MSPIDLLDLGWRRRLPLVLQTEAAECGLSCLAMVAGYYRQDVRITDLRRSFGLSQKGATLKDLVHGADQIGFAPRAVRLELDELHQLKTPCILHWDLNHFVVLERVGRNQVVIHDPGEGVRRLTFAEVSRHFTGVALELTPTAAFRPAAAPPRVGLRALLGRMSGVKRAFGQLFVLALAIELFALLSPLFLGWVVDHALVTADRDLLVTLVLGFALLLVLQATVSAMRGWMLIAFGASLKVQARTNLFTHLLRLPTAFFEARHVADVLSRFGSQETILQMVTAELVTAVLDALMCCLTIAVMFMLAPTLTVIILVGALLYALLRVALYVPLRQASAEAIVWSARRDSHFLESLRGMTAIKLFNAQDDRRAHWLGLMTAAMNRQITKQKLDLAFRIGNMVLLSSISLLVIWIGALAVLDGVFTVGLLIAFLAYKDMFLRRISEVIDQAVDFRMLRLHAERLADIALTEPEAAGELRAPPTVRRPLTVEARELSFRYGSNDRWVLRNIAFRIEAGQAVAITGPSGCGKSTLLKIMAGLLPPTSGSICIDGEPLSQFGLERYRERIGVVMQDDQLFAGSVADNVAFFAARRDQARIEHCAQLAAVADDICAMPMGYATLIGDMGTVLSGGQKQRVLIARALYRDPSLLLLDEATSHLDVAREAAVNDTLRSMLVTRVVVAHRPETIRASDRVLVLADGHLVDDRTGVHIEAVLPPSSGHLTAA